MPTEDNVGKYFVSQESMSTMLKRLAKLDALEAAGVDNWDGYDYAMESLWEEEGED